MNKLTRKDLNRWKEYARQNGYEIKTGYCCRYDGPDKASDLLELGYNSGVYGWNWSLYLGEKTLYIDGYRNY